MLFSKFPPAALILASALGPLAGCAGPRAAGVGDLSPGITAIRVSNHVASPGVLDGLSIAVDGETVPLAAVPPAGDDVATVAKLRLAPGPHSIAVRARARARGADVLVVGAQQPFHVGRAPAALTVDVRSIAFAEGAAAEPVTVSLTIEGGRMAPGIGDLPADNRDERCAGLLPIPRAICRAAFDLDQAARKNDVVAALCVRDKLAEMRRLALVGETGKPDAVALAEASVASLSRQIDLCAGAYAAPAPPDGLHIIKPKSR